jgi:hypothetical protein
MSSNRKSGATIHVLVVPLLGVGLLVVPLFSRGSSGIRVIGDWQQPTHGCAPTPAPHANTAVAQLIQLGTGPPQTRSMRPRSHGSQGMYFEP